MAASWLSKYFGLSERIWFIKGKASIAVPSTTSIITEPTILFYFSPFDNISVTLAHTDPPIEWPTKITFLSGYLFITSFKTYTVSLQRDYMDISSKFLVFLECPWPLKSKATNVPKCLTSLAKQAKLCAEWPAPWIQKYKAPSWPALKVDVPSSKKDN